MLCAPCWMSTKAVYRITVEERAEFIRPTTPCGLCLGSVVRPRIGLGHLERRCHAAFADIDRTHHVETQAF